MAETKTNAMRQLDRAKIAYIPHSYDASDGAIDGVSVAKKLGIDPKVMYKTLVTKAASGAVCVFVVNVDAQLDLKAAARAAGEKSVSMIHVKELFALTGYVRGGCSPIGMKKRYKTVIDSSAQNHDRIIVSAGRIGSQIELSPDSLAAAAGASFADIESYSGL